jgi:hypothetical protein
MFVIAGSLEAGAVTGGSVSTMSREPVLSNEPVHNKLLDDMMLKPLHNDSLDTNVSNSSNPDGSRKVIGHQ